MFTVSLMAVHVRISHLHPQITEGRLLHLSRCKLGEVSGFGPIACHPAHQHTTRSHVGHCTQVPQATDVINDIKRVCVNLSKAQSYTL